MELLNRLNYRPGKTAKGIAIGLLGIVFAAIGILPTEQRQRVDKCWANNVTHNYWNDTVTFNCSYGTGAYRPIKNAIIYNRYSHVSKEMGDLRSLHNGACYSVFQVRYKTLPTTIAEIVTDKEMTDWFWKKTLYEQEIDNCEEKD